MATQVHNTLIVSSSATTKATKNRSKMSVDPDIGMQNAYLAHELVYFLLKEEGVRLNGYVNSDGPQARSLSACLTDPKFCEAHELLKRACVQFKEQHREELIQAIVTLDTYDAQLHGSYHRVCSTIVQDDVRWGRIVSLFIFTAMLGLRLRKEGQPEKIESLVCWLKMFLNENVTDWVSRHGGWAGVNNTIKPQPVPEPVKTHTSSGGTWLTFAAVGLGAMVVGALLQR